MLPSVSQHLSDGAWWLKYTNFWENKHTEFDSQSLKAWFPPEPNAFISSSKSLV